ncbi:DUF7344 domain-containing protein [Halosimplex salinum]|uniref:DUF7344 domain-containing protein n=1 Tax=Halosimplex salinum TaxID=1710538 RepID=UPI000F495990|nr:hypothetical protein [Halosimplex salinum]
MTDPLSGERNWSTDEILACLADHERRVVLSTLRERTTHVSIEELATHVAAAVADESLVDVSQEERDSVHVDLYHAHLPKLADAGLIEWNADDDAVTTTDHPAIRDDRIRRLTEVRADDWDGVLEAIGHTRRRLALSVVRSADSIGRTALARRVANRENQLTPGARSDVEEVLNSLHHVHLPTLERAGLVGYDGETSRYTGHPDLESEWLEIEPEGAFEQETDTADEMENVWSIEGAGDIVARGQSLFEQADDELFLMISTDGLLQRGCVTRLEDALDRGVDVYLGSQSSEVRDFVREELPEVVIWEPQLDWMNLPPHQEKVGRLVLADREAVLVGTLGEQTEDGYEEMAITGDGDDNAFVVLLRQLLGDRLDHLDTQSEDFLTQLPL